MVDFDGYMFPSRESPAWQCASQAPKGFVSSKPFQEAAYDRFRRESIPFQSERRVDDISREFLAKRAHRETGLPNGRIVLRQRMSVDLAMLIRAGGNLPGFEHGGFNPTAIVNHVRQMLRRLAPHETVEGGTIMVLHQLWDAILNDDECRLQRVEIREEVAAIPDAMSRMPEISVEFARGAYRKLRSLGMRPFVPIQPELSRDSSHKPAAG